jgi:hypothetical protein
MKRIGWALAIFVGLSSVSSALADDAASLKIKLMKTTKLIAIGGDAVKNFAPDNDPDTLQVVFMASNGPSHVSEDGEVIYISPDITPADEQALIQAAFDIRVRLRLQKK